MVIFPFGSLAKSIVYSYLHVDVIDYVGTTTTTVSIKGALIKTHFELLKKINLLWLEDFFVKCKSNNDKGDLDWTIEPSIATKMTIIPPFDPLIKLFSHPMDIINSFGYQMLQPFTTMHLLSLAYVVRLMGNMISWLPMGPRQKTFKLWMYILLCQVLLPYIIMFSTTNVSYLWLA